MKIWEMVIFHPAPCDVDEKKGAGIPAVILDFFPDGTADICLVGYNIVNAVREKIKPLERALDNEQYFVQKLPPPHFNIDEDF